MPKFLLRIVALLLVPCLIIDAALAATVTQPQTPLLFSSRIPSNQALFQKEAFVERTLWHLQSLAQKLSAIQKHEVGLADSTGATPQAITGTAGGFRVYIGIMPVLEEALRWKGMYVSFITPHFFLWFVLIFPMFHALMHLPLDWHIQKENGWNALGKRMAARFGLSALFGFIGWGSAMIWHFAPITFGAIRPVFIAHVLNNAFYKELHSLAMSVAKRPPGANDDSSPDDKEEALEAQYSRIRALAFEVESGWDEFDAEFASRLGTSLVAAGRRLSEDELLLPGIRIQTTSNRPATPLTRYMSSSDWGRILTPLFTNALHAMANSNERMLVIDAGHDHEGDFLRISDTGHGMSKEAIEKLGTGYSLKDSDLTGTGQGTSIIRDIIEKNKGRLLIDSTEGKGTTFTIRFEKSTVPVAAGIETFVDQYGESFDQLWERRPDHLRNDAELSDPRYWPVSVLQRPFEDLFENARLGDLGEAIYSLLRRPPPAVMGGSLGLEKHAPGSGIVIAFANVLSQKGPTAWWALEHMVRTLFQRWDANPSKALEIALVRNILKRWRHPNGGKDLSGREVDPKWQPNLASPTAPASWKDLLIALLSPDPVERHTRPARGGSGDFMAVRSLIDAARQRGIDLAGKTVASIGPGTVLELAEWENRAPEIGQILGVELLAGRLAEIGESLFAEYRGLTRKIRLYQASITNLARIANESLTLVLGMRLVLWENGMEAADHVIRILEPGGMAHLLLDWIEPKEGKFSAMRSVLQSAGEIIEIQGGKVPYDQIWEFKFIKGKGSGGTQKAFDQSRSLRDA